jgi:hypothetical protein
MKPKNWTGQTFNQLTGLRQAYKDSTGLWYWVWSCTCGKEVIAKPSHVNGGKIKSCGCFRRKFIGDMFRTHGRGQDTNGAYSVWKNMLTRCNNPANEAYQYYGARGITVCPDWHKFENFLADMGEPPKGLTLERIDNDKGYYKENCKWATITEQRNNRSDSIKNILAKHNI